MTDSTAQHDSDQSKQMHTYSSVSRSTTSRQHELATKKKEEKRIHNDDDRRASEERADNDDDDVLPVLVRLRRHMFDASNNRVYSNGHERSSRQCVSKCSNVNE